MTHTPMDVVIVGGSLAGLMHGIMIKRLGHNVHVLEQNASSLRAGHAAGISAGPQVQEFFKAQDLCKQPFSLDCPGIQFIDENSRVKRFLKRPYHMSSWSVLYYRLRANFDGFASEYCPQPPVATEKEGKAIYHTQKRVTDVSYTDGSVTVRFEDLLRGVHDSLHADLVIAADGSNSIIRRMLLPEVQRPYAGYLAWRGTVREGDVSEETRKIFDGKITVQSMSKNYILMYIIPGERGSLEPGERLLNFIWYCNCPEQSQEFGEIMTDCDGHRHANMVPIGKVAEDVWAKQRTHGKSVLARPFAELLENTRQPFISAISDSIAPRASFFDGKLLLVGDAFALFRPHIALSTNQAALHCILLEKVLKGEMSLSEWEREVIQYGRKTRLLSIAFGNYSQVGGWTLVKSVIRYCLVLVGQWLTRLLWKSRSASR